MNNCSFIGRVTRDIELKTTHDGKHYCRFTLACDRGYKKQTDFIPCVAWDKRAETIAQYVKKGHRFSVTGRMQTGSYDGDHGKVFTADIYVLGFDFLEHKNDRHEMTESDDMQDVFDTDLPF